MEKLHIKGVYYFKCVHRIALPILGGDIQEVCILLENTKEFSSPTEG